MKNNRHKTISKAVRILCLLIFVLWVAPSFAFFEDNLRYEEVMARIQRGEDVNQFNEKGMTSLMHAALYSNDVRIRR